MPRAKPPKPEPSPDSSQATAVTLATALVTFSKALKALSFYPKEHPRREESCREALRQLTILTCERELSLLIRREGIAPTGRPTELLTTPAVISLARELLTRRIKQLHFLPTLNLADLRSFLELLSMDPTAMGAAGSMEGLMASRRIETIWINEIDLAKVSQQRPEPGESDSGEGRGEKENAAADLEQGLGSLASLLEESMAAIKESEQISFPELLKRLSSEPDDQRFVTMLLDLLSHVQTLLENQSHADVVPALTVLASLAINPRLESTKRRSIGQAMERCLPPSMAAYLAVQLGTSSAHEATILNLCKVIPDAMVTPLLQQLVTVEDDTLPRALTQAIIACGQPSVHRLLAMLRDKRWYVVRNAVAILGEMAHKEMVGEIRDVLQHEEVKVRREAVRALLRIGGREAEAAMLNGLDDPEPDMVRQTVLALGALKSRLAVPRLLAILSRRDLFLSRLAVKKDTVLALGRIGDPLAVTPLLTVLATRHILFPGRWQVLRSAAATALGQLADQAALPTLQRYAGKRSPLGVACRDALNQLTRDT